MMVRRDDPLEEVFDILWKRVAESWQASLAEIGPGGITSGSW